MSGDIIVPICNVIAIISMCFIDDKRILKFLALWWATSYLILYIMTK